MSKTLQSIDSEKRESIIIGDMNVNYLIENNHEVMKDIFTDNGFKQILNTPTRVTDQIASLIDLIFVNDYQNIRYKTKYESETIRYRD